MTICKQQFHTSAKGHHTCPPWSVSGTEGANLCSTAWLPVSVQLFGTSQTNVLWAAEESQQAVAKDPCTKARELGLVAGRMPAML